MHGVAFDYRVRADICPRRRRATLDNAWKSASAVGGQRTV